ncbi:hypothetical protein HDU87_003513 [Geranomyces variabilis]|uniref:Uncharacterized protein n=1 Tax=Geranomyces variabilis TaxID=109894 RepID=A0AAD5TKL0_9FUNG|nr:hypothetical protein HDU87_003513 [Geranomyces variabilis]
MPGLRFGPYRLRTRQQLVEEQGGRAVSEPPVPPPVPAAAIAGPTAAVVVLGDTVEVDEVEVVVPRPLPSVVARGLGPRGDRLAQAADMRPGLRAAALRSWSVFSWPRKNWRRHNFNGQDDDEQRIDHTALEDAEDAEAELPEFGMTIEDFEEEEEEDPSVPYELDYQKPAARQVALPMSTDLLNYGLDADAFAATHRPPTPLDKVPSTLNAAFIKANYSWGPEDLRKLTERHAAEPFRNLHDVRAFVDLEMPGVAKIPRLLAA